MRVKTNHIESQANKLWMITDWFFLSYIQYWYLFKLYCYIAKTYTFDIIKKSSSFSINAKPTFADEINLNPEYFFNFKQDILQTSSSIIQSRSNTYKLISEWSNSTLIWIKPTTLKNFWN